MQSATTDLKPHEIRLLEALASWRGPETPLFANLARELGLANDSSVRYTFVPLEESGYVERVKVGELLKVPQLTNKGRDALGLLPQPRVLDIRNTRLEQPIPVIAVSCGELKEAPNEPAYYVEFLGDIFESYRHGDQLLFAEGDSMISPHDAEDSIFPGDRCLIRPDIWPGPHEVVYVDYRLDSGMRERTLKEWHQDEHSGLVTLTPRNPYYPTIVRVVDELTPLGVVMEIVRSMRAKRVRDIEYSYSANGHNGTTHNGTKK